MQQKTKICYPACFIVLIAAIAILLAHQGWNARFISFDMLVHIDDARRFLEHGDIPEKGTLTSFASYAPPGLTWLFIPGAYVFADPRLFESLGAALLYAGTLVGIFLLARWAFGVQCAYLAVALWGLSELGLRFAETTAARGHPFFYVWLVYLAGRWVQEKESKYLVAALLVWVAGMYCMMEIAPAIFIVPALWLYFRPPLRLRPFLIAAILCLVIWSPYLRFEATRSFADLASQISRQRILPTDFAQSWCDPELVPASWVQSHSSPASGFEASIQSKRDLAFWASAIVNRASLVLHDLLLANYSFVAAVPGASLILFLGTIATMAVLGAAVLSFPIHVKAPRKIRWSKWIGCLGLSLVVGSVLFNELTLASLSPDGVLQGSTIEMVRTVQIISLVLGVGLVIFRKSIGSSVNRLSAKPERVRAETSGSVAAAVIAIGLAVPWVILLMVTEGVRPQRMWWLWPLQTVILAAAVTFLPKQADLSRFWIWLGSFALLVLIVGNDLLLSRVTAWAADGWSGKQAEQITAVDDIAARITAQRKNTAAIGYSTFVPRFMATFNAADPRYKIGADFDLFFRSRHGIINSNQCAEGISEDDEYRVWQTSGAAKENDDYITPPGKPHFQVVKDFSSYRVMQRN